MKKPYSLDYSIERDTDRLHAVEEILDKLETTPSSKELEQMGSYILYGKDENGLNAYQRGEMLADRRYGSFRTREDKNISLDALLENPLTDERQFREMGTRDPYKIQKTTIRKPKYDKDGNLLDIGDADIPGMTELWASIEAMEHRIALIEGKIAPEPTDTLNIDSYKLYKLKHALIDVRRHQYYLKDAYKPTIHWLNVDKPKRQYIDWNCDTYYWMPLSKWQERIDSNYFPNISSNLSDYETRQLPNSQEIEVKWVVRKHTFNWEDSNHVRAFIQLYWRLRELLRDKLDTVGKTLFFDFDFYRKQAHLTPIQEWMLDCRLAQLSTHEICILLPHHWQTSYTENHLSSILNSVIPTAIAQAATRRRMLLETPPSQMKKCNHCGRLQPRDLLFFGRNNDRKDKFESTCKDCQRNERLGKGVQYKYEPNTNKTKTMRKMQARTT